MSDLPPIPFKPICPKCEREPDVIMNDEAGQQVVCRGCGQTDKLEDAKRIAGEHLKQQLIPGIQDIIGGAVKGSKALKFMPKRQPKRAFKWHAQLV
jgi:hypothetical protein